MFHPQPSTDQFLDDLPTYLPNEEPSEKDKKVDIPKPPQFNEFKAEEPQSSNSINSQHQINNKPTKINKPVRISGTNITLQTEEDIAKWIEERKKNWPTKSNMEKKQQLKEEKRRKFQENQTRSINNNQSKRKLEDSNEPEGNSNKKGKNLCRHFQQFKKCKFGNKCKNIHEISNDPNPIAQNFKNDLTHTKRKLNGITILIPKLYSNRTENTPTSNSSLFKHLITQDRSINENQVVIDFIKYLDDKGMINHDVMK
ncbi:hypothetical protein KGF54_002646 [Candida jiufengensis]|uniref:uncharacterized protein n=1 Tax=Candida jiufengensis TaxID=497108 RepID=UPI002225B33D|nr:uncharacterized protein KGF54_002646 [Candida jiufengensis]KAI5953275.1 hypothetical protein KGF54_002646 [Candida jiufengensis]